MNRMLEQNIECSSTDVERHAKMANQIGRSLDARKCAAILASSHVGPVSAVGSRQQRPKVLIVDTRAVMGIELCRSLGRKGYRVDVVGERLSPAFCSRWCDRAFLSPGITPRSHFIDFITSIVKTNEYEGIFVCNEEVLDCLLDLPKNWRWKGLLVGAPDRVRVALGRTSVVRLAESVGIDVPRTVIPADESELDSLADTFGFPLLVKGDRGEAGNHIRLVQDQKKLRSAYYEILNLERDSPEPPVLQEFVHGPAYSVGGLYYKGQPLRVCAHRKIVGLPPLGGLTAKGVTERVDGAIQAAFAIFAALDYTGLGHAEFIRDREGRYRFLEVNPRLWGTYAVAEYAGVDLFTPYLKLVAGERVDPNLEFKEGVVFHRILREARLLRNSPSHILRIIKDCIDPSVRSDFAWSDPLPHLFAVSERAISRGKRA